MLKLYEGMGKFFSNELKGIFKKNLKTKLAAAMVMKNIKDFKRSGRVRFTGDSFIEGIEFDYMEMSVLEEDMIF